MIENGELRTLASLLEDEYAHAIYLPGAVAVLAANTRFGHRSGSRGRRVSLLSVLAIATYVGSVFVVALGSAVSGTISTSVGTITGVAYLPVRFLGTLYAISLWQQSGSNRSTAGLFVVLFPAVFVVGLLTIPGLSASWIEATFYLAIVALGIELVREGPRSS